MSEHGLLTVLSGLPGVGKDTVRKTTFESEDNDSQYPISMTTRKMHEGKVEGIDYFLRSKEEFEPMIEAGEMLEYAECVGNYYGTPLPCVNKILDEGKDVFLEIEVQGAKQVKEKVLDGVFTFLIPPDLAELKSRIVGRGTGADEVIEERTKVVKEEIEMMALYDYTVVSDEMPLAAERIKYIIANEHLRVDRVIGKYVKILKKMQSYDIKAFN